MNKWFLIVLGLVVAGLIGVFVLGNNKAGENTQNNSQTSSNVYGKLDSPVQLTEFLDFQCEACLKYYPFVKEVKEKYKDKVKFQFKYFPISSGHANAMPAARAAQAAAKQGKFFEMHNLLFDRQKKWEDSQQAAKDFELYASELGLDIEQYSKDVNSKETTDIINADLAEVKKLGGNGTPTFILNGSKIENPKPTVDDISRVLDEALKKAGVQ